MAALGTRLLKIKIGAVDYTVDVSRCEITSKAADSDFTSFADAAAGGAREYALEFTARQDLATATLWRNAWASAGTTVAVKIAPYGNTAAATTTEPHFTGNVTITEPDGTLIGGEAKSSVSARMPFACRWVFTAKPTEVTTGAF
jgi:hypothetical protein